MAAIRIRDVIKRDVLVTRESARSLKPDLMATFGSDAGLELDFADVQGMTTSFFDELLRVLAESAPAGSELHVEMLNPPAELSSKFEAVARGHELDLTRSGKGSWLVRRTALAGR